MTDPINHSEKIAGAALIAASFGAVLFMAHHPTLGTPGYETLAAEIIAEARINSTIHGVMIFFTLVYYFSMRFVADRLDRRHLAVSAAQIAFAAATIMMVGAALASGFLTVGLAERFVDQPDGGEETLRTLLIFESELNQLLAKGGSIAYGAAILFWSFTLAHRKNLTRIAGLIGVTLGPIIAISVGAGYLTLNVMGMGVIVAAMGVWFCLIGVQMIRHKL